MTARRIGTVRIHRQRYYPLDPVAASAAQTLGLSYTDVAVEPGDYPLMRDGMSTWWEMTGRVNMGRIRRLGDGVFTITPADDPTGPEVQFMSPVYGDDEFADLRRTISDAVTIMVVEGR